MREREKELEILPTLYNALSLIPLRNKWETGMVRMNTYYQHAKHFMAF